MNVCVRHGYLDPTHGHPGLHPLTQHIQGPKSIQPNQLTLFQQIEGIYGDYAWNNISRKGSGRGYHQILIADTMHVRRETFYTLDS